MAITVEELKRADREVIGHYVELKQDGDHWTGLCPFHDDRNPSFVVFGDGRGFHCFGCQANGDVFDFLQKREGMDFKEAKRRVEEITGLPGNEEQKKYEPNNLTAPYPLPDPHRRVQGSEIAGNGHSNFDAGLSIQPRNDESAQNSVVETYSYTDENGNLLYEVLRYEPKSFRQRRPDGKGGWQWGLGDVRRPLYRLPRIADAPAVVFVEGEKDVHTLEKMGFTATTNSGGSSQPWREEWTKTLTGKRVVIIPDSDEPGRKHAAKVREALDGVAEVAILNLPDGRKDVTEFVEGGGTADDIRKLIAQARKEAEEANRPWWHSISTMDDLKPEPVQWLLKPIIPEGAFVLMAGTPGSYKSFLALDIARAVATGEGFAQMGKTQPRDVLYVDLENPRNVIASRKEFLGIPPAPRLRYWGRWSALPFFGIDSRELLAYAAAEKPLMIFDSLVRFHRSDENSNSEMAKVMGDFLALARAGATVILLHHAGKDESKNARGAIEVEAAPDVAYRIQRKGERLVRMFQFKNRLSEEQTFDLRLTEGGFESLPGGLG